MLFRRIFIAAAILLAGGGVVWACGPFFPWQLLDDRERTMSDPVGFDFAFEISRLIPAVQDNLHAVEKPPWTSEEAPEAVTAERKEALSGAWINLLDRLPPGGVPELVLRWQTARNAADGRAAISAGAGLPPAVLDYIAGAVEFRAGRLDAAGKYFKAIDRLPPEQKQIRIVAARYMQGRIYQLKGETAAARAAFQDARSQALAGAPDPIGLAVSSFGEEARIDLVEAGLVKVPWPIVPSKDDAHVARLITKAVRLYVEQAARGSQIALSSLRDVATSLVARREELNLAVADPLVRRFLVAYAVARDGQSPWGGDGMGSEFPVLARVTEAVLAQPSPPAGDDLDRLAALAYRAGQYDAAEELTASANRPLGLWVRAKLALRRGDRAAAAQDWTAALAGTEYVEDGGALNEPAKIRLRGELAIIRLSRGEYQDSLRLLFPVAETYWGDVIYIAERVLTVDELKNLVDDLPRRPASRLAGAVDERGFAHEPTESLRALLARRLVREGRTGEALPYFSSVRSGSTPANDTDAYAYHVAVEAARPGWPLDWPWQKTSRAEALFAVAMLARMRGMELMGTEGPPDEAALGGAYPDGVGQVSPYGFEGRSDAADGLLGPDEVSRFTASAPKPDIRFHYRVIATDRALEAADLLPDRSQAYAATLCWAARFAADSADEGQFKAIYKRYLATGPYQAWAVQFGQVCPNPDFAAARTFWPRRIAAWSGKVTHSLWRHKFAAIAALLAAATLVVGLVWFARRPTGHSKGR